MSKNQETQIKQAWREALNGYLRQHPDAKKTISDGNFTPLMDVATGIYLSLLDLDAGHSIARDKAGRIFFEQSLPILKELVGEGDFSVLANAIIYAIEKDDAYYHSK